MRIRSGHSLAEDTHLHVGLWERDAELQPAIDQVVMGSVVAQLLRTESQRCPQLRVALRKECARRHHSNHGVGFVVKRDALADCAWLATEPPLPQFVAEQHDMVFAVSLFLWKKVASQDGADAEQSTDVCREIGRASCRERV